MENRRKPAPPAATLDINCDCKEYVIDYLTKSFPIRLMAVFTDENGKARSEPMNDDSGAPVLCRSALAARDRYFRGVQRRRRRQEAQGDRHDPLR